MPSWNAAGVINGTATEVFSMADVVWESWNSTGGYVYPLTSSNLPTTIYQNATVTPGTTWTGTWTNWNGEYEETVQERRQHLLDRCRRDAREQGYSQRPVLDVRYPLPDDVTDDEIREIEDAFQRAREERIEQDRVHERRETEKVAAQRRAEKLLVSLLTHEQKQEWLEHKRVTEVASSGRIWRFTNHWSGGANIMSDDGKRVRTNICVHPRERVPVPDMIAGLLLTVRSGSENELINLGIAHDGQWSDEELEIRRNGPLIRSVYVEEMGGRINVAA